MFLLTFGVKDGYSYRSRQVSGYCFVSEWISPPYDCSVGVFFFTKYICRILFTYNIYNNKVVYTVIIDIVYLKIDIMTLYILIHVRCSNHITSVVLIPTTYSSKTFSTFQLPKCMKCKLFLNIILLLYLFCSIFIFFCCFVMCVFVFLLCFILHRVFLFIYLWEGVMAYCLLLGGEGGGRNGILPIA